jgi:hypothetical protein
VAAALSLYAPPAKVIGDAHLRTAHQLADLGSGLTRHTHKEVAEARLQDPPQSAGYAAVALGIAMARYRVLPTEGFRMLSDSADDLEISLFAMAREVVLAGRLPARDIQDARIARRTRAAQQSTNDPSAA